MFPNDLQREAMKTDTVETLFKQLKVSINIWRSYVYIYQERYELPIFRSGRICDPKFQNLYLFVTGYLQIGTHLNFHSFQLEVLGFQTFQRELSVV